MADDGSKGPDAEAGYDIGRPLADSTAPQSPAPHPTDAPTGVVSVLDDLGFAQLGWCGSDPDTTDIDLPSPMSPFVELAPVGADGDRAAPYGEVRGG